MGIYITKKWRNMGTNFLTVEEFAQRIKMCRGTVIRAIRSGKIFASRPSIGKRSPYRIAESELERLHLQSMCEKKN
jgi:excisionase family DNA binding protein